MNIIIPVLYVLFLLFSRLVAPNFEVVEGFKEVHTAVFNAATAIVIYFLMFRYYNITKKDVLIPILGVFMVGAIGFFFNPMAVENPILPILVYSLIGALIGGTIGTVRRNVA